MKCESPTCPRGCGGLSTKETTPFTFMYFCGDCNAWWRHVATVEGCGLIGTIPKDIAAKETFHRMQHPTAKEFILTLDETVKELDELLEYQDFPGHVDEPQMAVLKSALKWLKHFESLRRGRSEEVDEEVGSNEEITRPAAVR